MSQPAKRIEPVDDEIDNADELFCDCNEDPTVDEEIDGVCHSCGRELP